MKRGAWVELRCPTCSGANGATVAVGCADAPHAAAVSLVDSEQFDGARANYLDRLGGVLQLPSITFAAEGERRLRAVSRAREGHRRAMRALYALLLDGILPPPEEYGVVARRCEHLLKMPTALLSAVAAPERFRGVGLPLDLHPRLSHDDALRLAACPERWPCPRTADVCILLGEDLGEGAIAALDEHDRVTVEPLDAAAVVRWSADRAAALAAAETRGARVVPLTVDALLDAIEGKLGEYVQIVASIVEEDGAPLLLCRDTAVDLARLAEAMIRIAGDGFRSPLRALDLTACHSSGDLSHAFHAVGVHFVTSSPVSLHTGTISEGLRRMYEMDLLDGRTPFQHAWIWAHLG